MTKLAYSFALAFAFVAAPAMADNWQPVPSAPHTVIVSPAPVIGTPQVIQGPQYRAVPSYQPAPAYSAQQQSFFGRLLELERRKNAWLRQQFLGY